MSIKERIILPREVIPPPFKNYFIGLEIEVLWPDVSCLEVISWRDVPKRKMEIIEILTKDRCRASVIVEDNNFYVMEVMRSCCILCSVSKLEETRVEYEMKDVNQRIKT